jgi:hypothetical protein
VQRARDTVQSDLGLVDSQVRSLKTQCDLRRKELSDLELVLVKGKSTRLPWSVNATPATSATAAC